MSNIDREKWNQRYREGAYAERTGPSPFLEQWIEKVPAGRALDVACGAGRNSLYLAQRGFSVDAVDISGVALERARRSARTLDLSVNWLERDLEEPLALDGSYQLILVIRYVNLPQIQALAASLARGGLLVCELHGVTNADVVGPKNPAYRIKSDDLRAAARGLRIDYLEEVVVPEPDGRMAALVRLVAGRPM